MLPIFTAVLAHLGSTVPILDRIIKWLLGAAFIFLLLASPAAAQTPTPVPSPTPATTVLAWDHTGVNITGFRLVVDGVVTPATIAETVREIPFPALTPGNHTLVIRAFNIAGLSPDSNVLSVRVVVVPDAATNLRIIVK